MTQLYFILIGLLSLSLVIFQTLSQVKEEIEKLKENIRKVEEMDVTRAELGNLEMELPWAVVSLMVIIQFYKTGKHLSDRTQV